MAIEHRQHNEIDITLRIHTKIDVFPEILNPSLFVLLVRDTVLYCKLYLLRLVDPPFVLDFYSYRML